MGDIHILVVESDTPEIVARFRAQGRLSEADNFAEVLHQIDTSIHTSIIAPYAGECCTAQFLAGVSGVCFTGSCVDWCVDDMRAAALESTMRTVFEAGVPVYGSCNGLQMAVHVLGGTLRASPAGREDGIARNVTLSPAAHSHPMMRGRDAVYTAVCVHRDEVHTPPPGAVVLAGNDHSAVQAMVFEQEQVCFWGTQYHPEFTARYVGETLGDMRLSPAVAADMLSVEGEGGGGGEGGRDGALAGTLGTSAAALSHHTRTLELQNWVKHVAAQRAVTAVAS